MEERIKVSYKILFTKQAQKDYEKIKASQLKNKVYNLLSVIKENSLQPPIEKLVGNLQGAYSKRLNIQHRLVYRIEEDVKTVIVLQMWTHYE